MNCKVHPLELYCFNRDGDPNHAGHRTPDVFQRLHRLLAVKVIGLYAGEAQCLALVHFRMSRGQIVLDDVHLDGFSSSGESSSICLKYRISCVRLALFKSVLLNSREETIGLVRVEVVRDTTVGTAVAAAAVFDRHLCLTTWMQSSEIVFLRTSVTRSPECRGFRLLLVPAVLAGITLPRNHPRSPFCIESVADALVTSAGVKVVFVDVPGTSCTRSLVVDVTTLHQLVIRSLAVKRIITGVLGRDALVVCFCVEVFAVGVRATRDVWTLFVDARSC